MMQHHLEADSFIIDFVYLNFTSLNNVLMCILKMQQNHARRMYSHSCIAEELCTAAVALRV